MRLVATQLRVRLRCRASFWIVLHSTSRWQKREIESKVNRSKGRKQIKKKQPPTPSQEHGKVATSESHLPELSQSHHIAIVTSLFAQNLTPRYQVLTCLQAQNRCNIAMIQENLDRDKCVPWWWSAPIMRPGAFFHDSFEGFEVARQGELGPFQDLVISFYVLACGRGIR